MEYDIHTILDFATFITTLWVIYMIRFKLKASYMEEKDNFAIYYVVSSNASPTYCFILRLEAHHHLKDSDILLVLIGESFFSFSLCRNGKLDHISVRVLYSVLRW